MFVDKDVDDLEDLIASLVENGDLVCAEREKGEHGFVGSLANKAMSWPKLYHSIVSGLLSEGFPV